MTVEVITVSAYESQKTGSVNRGSGCYVVDDSADRSWTIKNLARAFYDLNTLETINGWVVIRCVVTVGRVSKRQAILEQEHLCGARWIQSANTDVRAQTESFFVAHVKSRNLAQRLGGTKRTTGFQSLIIYNVNGSGRTFDDLGRSE